MQLCESTEDPKGGTKTSAAVEVPLDVADVVLVDVTVDVTEEVTVLVPVLVGLVRTQPRNVPST